MKKINPIFVVKLTHLKVTFLGTGTSQGIPIIGSNHPVCLSDNKKDKRLRVSILIEWNDYAYVIDCGPDFRYQMLRANCSKIDGIIFTHEHADHVAGLDDIRPFCFRQGPLPVFAHERVIKAFHERFAYIFETVNRYPGAPSVTTFEIKNEAFELGGLSVIPINLYHDKLQVFGYRFNNFAYLTDIKTIKAEEIEKLKNLDVLVVSALRIEPHQAHFNLDEALSFIDVIKPKKAYLTHISHRLGFHDDVQQKLPENVYLAYDNLELNL
jgi:phosphoribosyl 1,2-cyclic phosphate phosphodiesterase